MQSTLPDGLRGLCSCGFCILFGFVLLCARGVALPQMGFFVFPLMPGPLLPFHLCPIGFALSLSQCSSLGSSLSLRPFRAHPPLFWTFRVSVILAAWLLPSFVHSSMRYAYSFPSLGSGLTMWPFLVVHSCLVLNARGIAVLLTCDAG